MVRLIFLDAAAGDRVVANVGCTPLISGGVGPVALGVRAQLPDGRFVVAHPFSEADAQWLAAYIEEPGVEIQSD